ncbi:hypothetical protein [Nocardia mexicana]|uniref:Dynamin family protein n=1 Tax=Nocardia mexicana TaxID=279262 RepID=A0A370GW12_9NOCA|nr:hypothetical protein [Nocardia mexicana]RDI46784.1 hypothetical protein DFR68_110190 [Nocardia mexicana]
MPDSDSADPARPAHPPDGYPASAVGPGSSPGQPADFAAAVPGGGTPDPASASGVDAVPSLPPEAEAVVARWNPQGSALLRAVPGAGAKRAEPGTPPVIVALIGPGDANTTLLRTELARFEPHIDLSDPLTDPSTLVAPPPLALLLLDAGATLGAATLDLVARLRSGGTRIVFAMNGIHAHPDWRTVFDRNGALLGPVLGADPDIVPVSARLAVAARTNGDPSLLDRSGLGTLHAHLTGMIGASGGTGSAAAVIGRVLADTRGRIRAQVATLQSGESVARLREERATLLAGRDGGRAQAMAALRNRLHLARVDLLHEVGARIRALNATARTELDRLDRRATGDYPEQLQQAVNQLTAELDVVVGQRLAELGRQLEAVTGPAPGPGPGQLHTDPPPRLGPDPEPRHRGVEDYLMIALGTSAGFGLGRLVVSPLALVPALDYATVPVTLLLGAGVAYWVVRARGHLADRAHLRQWMSDALVNVKAQLEQRVATALVEAESRLTDQVVRASTARVVDADRRVAELEKQLRELSAQQPAQLAACERDLAVLDAAVPE